MSEKKTYYITTPIYYPSGNLHIGHAYTTVAADTMKRYKKMQGYDAYFLTGTDEHGLKIQKRAEEAGKSPQQFVDEIVAGIKDLWQLLNIDYDDFIRTTEERHQKVAQAIFQKIYDQGDIYKSEYEGWYCTPCETFFTERQVGEEHICPDCGRPVQLAKEESYFFKMSKYADRWLQFIAENPDFIQPETRKNEMVSFVKQGLDDLCVSRTTFSWGIPVPFNQKHVIYVWFDALINYISALGFGTDHDELYQKYWPADLHLMAKDIIRFHAIIWPIMLMAADIPLPKQVMAHGWLLMNDSKMSKSKGNVVDPVILANRYGVDTIRYFLLREMAFGMDANYSEESLVNRMNIDLANDYGNLLSRTTSMMEKFCDGIVGAPGVGTEFDADLIALAKETPVVVASYFDKTDLANGLAAIWKLINKANKYIDNVAPWALNKAGEKEKLQTVLYNLAEVLRLVTIMMSPAMPNTAARVWQQLGVTAEQMGNTWPDLTWGKFPSGITIHRGEALFPRMDWEAIQKEMAAEEKVEEEKPQFEPIGPEITIDDFAKLDLRVADILACERVPKSEKLLKFLLKVGEEERVILSGIAKYYEPEKLVGKKVIIIANLKPRKMMGIESKGMILSASLGDDLELLSVEKMIAGATVG